MDKRRQDEIKTLRRNITDLRRLLFNLELDDCGDVAHMAHLAVERLVLTGFKSPALKRLERGQLEKFARAALTPPGPPFYTWLKSFRRAHGDLLKQSAAYRLRRAIQQAAEAVVERRPIEPHELCS